MRAHMKANAIRARLRERAEHLARTAAQRYGFSFEGVFRQANVVKGRTRDSAWFSILDGEWPALRVAYERWLAPENFDSEGRQKLSLAALNGQKA